MSPELLVLLVEDEPVIADLTESALVDSGYEVVKATNGEAALDQIQSGAAQFRAVVTDIKLGSGPDGWEIACRTRESIPTMPIVYMSGDSASDWAAKGVPGSMILSKPFAPAQLVTAVSSLVNEADMHASPPPDDD